MPSERRQKIAILSEQEIVWLLGFLYLGQRTGTRVSREAKDFAARLGDKLQRMLMEPDETEQGGDDAATDSAV